MATTVMRIGRPCTASTGNNSWTRQTCNDTRAMSATCRESHGNDWETATGGWANRSRPPGRIFIKGLVLT